MTTGIPTGTSAGSEDQVFQDTVPYPDTNEIVTIQGDERPRRVTSVYSVDGGELLYRLDGVETPVPISKLATADGKPFNQPKRVTAIPRTMVAAVGAVLEKQNAPVVPQANVPAQGNVTQPNAPAQEQAFDLTQTPEFGALKKGIALYETGDRNIRSGRSSKRKDGSESWAYGNHQVMDFNVPVWTEEATGQAASVEDWVKNPKLQDATVGYKLKQYWGEAAAELQKRGVSAKTTAPEEFNRSVAALVSNKWFTGKYFPSASVKDSMGTTAGTYQKSVLRNYDNLLKLTSGAALEGDSSPTPQERDRARSGGDLMPPFDPNNREWQDVLGSGGKSERLSYDQILQSARQEFSLRAPAAKPTEPTNLEKPGALLAHAIDGALPFGEQYVPRGNFESSGTEQRRRAAAEGIDTPEQREEKRYQTSSAAARALGRGPTPGALLFRIAGSSPTAAGAVRFGVEAANALTGGLPQAIAGDEYSAALGALSTGDRSTDQALSVAGNIAGALPMYRAAGAAVRMVAPKLSPAIQGAIAFAAPQVPANVIQVAKGEKSVMQAAGETVASAAMGAGQGVIEGAAMKLAQGSRPIGAAANILGQSTLGPVQEVMDATVQERRFDTDQALMNTAFQAGFGAMPFFSRPQPSARARQQFVEGQKQMSPQAAIADDGYRAPTAAQSSAPAANGELRTAETATAEPTVRGFPEREAPEVYDDPKTIKANKLPIAITQEKGSALRQYEQFGVPVTESRNHDRGVLKDFGQATERPVAVVVGNDRSTGSRVFAADRYEQGAFQETVLALRASNDGDAIDMLESEFGPTSEFKSQGFTTQSQIRTWVNEGDLSKPFEEQRAWANERTLQKFNQLPGHEQQRTTTNRGPESALRPDGGGDDVQVPRDGPDRVLQSTDQGRSVTGSEGDRVAAVGASNEGTQPIQDGQVAAPEVVRPEVNGQARAGVVQNTGREVPGGGVAEAPRAQESAPAHREGAPVNTRQATAQDIKPGAVLYDGERSMRVVSATKNAVKIETASGMMQLKTDSALEIFAKRLRVLDAPDTPVAGGASGRPRTLTAPRAQGERPDTGIDHEVKTLVEIGAELTEGLNLSASKGGVTRKLAGAHNQKTGGTRLADLSDIATLVHEHGHALEKTLFPDKFASLPDQAWSELRTKGEGLYPDKAPSQGYEAEGFAEYLNEYVTDPQKAVADAPEFTKVFEARLKQAPEIAGPILRAREQAKIRNEAGAESRILATFSDGKQGRLTTIFNAQRARGLKGIAEEITHNWANDQDVVSRTEKRLTGDDNGPLVRKAEQAQRAASVAHHLIRTGEWEGKKLPAIAEIVNKFEKEGLSEKLEIYLAAWKAQDYFARGLKPSEMSEADARSVLDTADPRFKQAATEIRSVLDAVWTEAKNTGVIDEKTFYQSLTANPHYLPNLRERHLNSTRKRAGASDLKALPTTEATAIYLYKMIEKIERKRFENTFFKMIEEHSEGSAEIAEKVAFQPRDLAKRFQSEDLQQMLVDNGYTEKEIDALVQGKALAEGKQAMASELADLFWEPRLTARENRVIVRRPDGEMQAWQIKDPHLYHALSSDGRRGEVELRNTAAMRGMDWAKRSVIAINDARKSGVTETIPFAIGQVFLDGLSAWQRTVAPGIHLPWEHTARGAWLLTKARALDNPEATELLRGFMESGVPMARYRANHPEAAKDLVKDMRELNGGLRDKIRNVWQSQRDFAFTMEMLPRLAEYDLILKHQSEQMLKDPKQVGIDGKLTPEAFSTAKEIAAQAAQRVTQDFTKMGEMSRLINTYVPFFSANVGGTYQSYTRLRDHPMKTLVATGAKLSLPSVLLWWMQKDDPEYQTLTDDEKNRYWVFLNPLKSVGVGGNFYLPKPYLIGAVFATLPVAIMEAAYRDDPNQVGAAMDALWNAMKPPISPGFVSTPLQWMMNETLYNGQPIEPKYTEQLPVAMRAKRSTGEFARKMSEGLDAVGMAEYLGASPAKLEFLARDAFGYRGQTVVRILDAVTTGAEKAMGITPAVDRTAGVNVFQAFLGRYWRATDIRSDQMDRFYERATEVEQQLAKEGSKAPLALKRQHRLLDQHKTRLSDMRNTWEAIEQDDKLSTADKGRRLKDLAMQAAAWSQKAMGEQPIVPPRLEWTKPVKGKNTEERRDRAKLQARYRTR